MPQPPYSSDLVPVDFFLFRKLKTPMKGKLFATIEEIKEKSIPKSDTKKRVFKSVSRIGKNAGISELVLYLSGVTLKYDKIVIDK